MEINLIYSVTTSVVKKSILINCLILDKYGLAINSSIDAGPETVTARNDNSRQYFLNFPFDDKCVIKWNNFPFTNHSFVAVTQQKILFSRNILFCIFSLYFQYM